MTEGPLTHEQYILDKDLLKLLVITQTMTGKGKVEHTTIHR